MEPDSIVENILRKLKFLPQENCIVDMEEQRALLEKIFGTIKTVLQYDPAGFIFRGKPEDLYYKIPTKLFYGIASNLNMSVNSLAKSLYEMGLLLTYKTGGYQTRAKFGDPPSAEDCAEFGYTPGEAWKPWVYTVMKLEAYEQVMKQRAAALSINDAEEDAAFADDLTRGLLGTGPNNLLLEGN